MDLNENEKEKVVPCFNPLSVLDWAKENNKVYDIFVFLGSNNMILKDLKKCKQNYHAFSQKPVKYVHLFYVLYFVMCNLSKL